jgi:heparosan-N-sulfate-glucuronate 5-epimerase
MIYALWGLRDLLLLVSDSHAWQLFTIGVESVKNALPLFDTGFWSLNAVAEVGPSYIASMMYHNLHICQLTALATHTGDDVFEGHAHQFVRYAKNPLYRIRAGYHVFHAKCVRKLR